MKTYDLKQAAEILKMTPEGLRRKIAKGMVKAAKPGKRWCIKEEDLAVYLQSFYAVAANQLQGVSDRRNLWHSTKEKISGGLKSVTLERKYNEVLGR
jgi:excisionase family DNA binding protein